MIEKDLTQVLPPQPETPGLLAFHPDEYMAYIAELPLTDEQKVEFLQALWDIMSTFVRWGFGVDSVIPLLTQKASENFGDTLQEPIADNFNSAADDAAESETP